MAIYQRLLNFDEAFARAESKIIINDLASESLDDKEAINKAIVTNFSEDMINLVPSCSCGALKGEFNIGLICEECETEVKSKLYEEMVTQVWFRKPEVIKGLLSPKILLLLDKKFTKSRFSVLNWLLDTSFKVNTKTPPFMSKLLQAGLPRGYNNFVDHFDEIMEVLFSMREFGAKRNSEDPLHTLIKSERRKVFSEHIPLPNKSLLVIEKNPTGIYVDPMIMTAVDAIQSLISTDNSKSESKEKTVENRISKALFKLAKFYGDFISVSGVKKGHFRQHIFGSRSNFAFRCVATSITDSHMYDEVEMPWGAALGVFRIHLISKLDKLGMGLNDSIGLLNSRIGKYDPLLDKLLKELIAESKDKCIYALLGRNPTLLAGSLIRVKIKSVKTDPSDTTIGLSILAVKSLNADFDGDELNLSVAIDDFLAKKWRPLSPHFNVYEATEPFEISGNISIPKPTIQTISSWLDAK